MKARVVILYRLTKVEDTAVFVTVVGVSYVRKGKRTGGAFHFLLPAVYDVRSNDYIPDISQRILCTEDDKYYNSISQCIYRKFGVGFKHTKVLKIKDMKLEQ